MRLLIASISFLALLCVPASAADLSGTWKFSVDLESHEHGDPTFVLTQKDGKLSGTYNGPFGEQEATGVVTGDTAHLEVSAAGPGGSLKLTYEAGSQDRTR